MRFRIASFHKYAAFLVLCALVLVIGTPQWLTDLAETPGERVGAWNRFLGQSNIVECSNQSSDAVRARVTVRRSNGQALRIDEVVVPGHGSNHYLLDPFTVPDSYGTYSIAVLDGDDSLGCQTFFYGMRDGEPRFSYSLPLLAGYHGKTFGYFNSFDPTSRERAIANWLAIYNPSTSALSLDVLVFGVSGELQRTIPVANLAPFARVDLALGHPSGQQIGSYEIRPSAPEQRYGAYLARFAMAAGDVTTAYSLLPLAGSGVDSVVGTSTMGNALNWLELGNTSDAATSVLLTLRSQNGTVINSQTLELPAHGQQHVAVNEFLGPMAVGKAEIKCLSANCGEADTVVQSLFYGIDAGRLRWAYGSQGLPLGAGIDQALYFPVNTFLHAANWLKLTAPDQSPITAPIVKYDSSGVPLSGAASVSIRGTTDVGLHETYGPAAIGMIAAGPQPAAVTAELIRVFYGDTAGEIQHINPVRSIAEYDNALKMVREPDQGPGALRGSFGALERRQVSEGGKLVEKTFVSGWACRPRSSSPVTLEVKVGDRVIGSGTANQRRPAPAACPGMEYQGFAVEVQLPSNLALLDARISLAASDESGTISLPQTQANSVLSPGQIFSAFDNRFPKGIFFRFGGLEGSALELHRRTDPQRWERDLSSLDGAFAHPIDDTGLAIDSPAIADGLRQLGNNPGQLVLAQFSGVGMTPELADASSFGPEDWLYFPGCDSIGPVGENAVNIRLPEECFAKFRKCLAGVHTGNPRAPACIPENLVAVARATDGSLDWSQAEQLIVEDIEKVQVTPAVVRTQLTVRRGQFGGNAKNYENRVYVAPHSYTGPWKVDSPQIVWNYNLNRPSARRHLTSVLASYFLPGGVLEQLDGMTLDVSWWYRKGIEAADAANRLPGRQIDVDLDGLPDGGYAGSVNLYGKGVALFHEQLREALGPRKIILADGGVENSSRDFHVLNGSENEGFSYHEDPNFGAWSSAINRLLYTQNRTTVPSFKYVVHKNAPGISSARLVMAGSQITEMAFANIIDPLEMFSECTPSQWETLYNRSGIPVLDEMVRGADRLPHWLGRPAEALRRPAVNGPTVHPAGVEDLRSAIVALSDQPVTIQQASNQTVLAPTGPSTPEFSVSLPGLSANQTRDFTLTFELASQGDLDGFNGNPDIPRVVKASTTASILPSRVPGEPNPNKLDGLFGRSWSRVVFYYRNELAQDVDFQLTFEGSQPVAIRNVKFTHTSDILIRRFEHGLAVANPSNRDYTLNLAAAFPGKVFKRITATPCQATSYNDGRTEGATVSIAPHDGLFLIDATP